MKQWSTLPGSSYIESSRLFPFCVCSTFSAKSSFCYKQAVGQRHRCQCQCIRAHHTVSCSQAKHGEQYAYQPLRHWTVPQEYRVSDHYVSASSRPTGLRLSHVHDPLAESASKCFDFALWYKKFDDFSFVGTYRFVSWLHSIDRE